MNTLLGQRMREQRKSDGQSQFAGAGRVVSKLCWRLRARSKNPKLETFIRIVEVLDVSADADPGFSCICFLYGR